MKLYISGPMNGYPDLNKKAFKVAENLLHFAGYETVNPHDIEPEFGSLTTTDIQPNNFNYLRGDLIEMLKCDGVAVIGNTTCSWGATIEIDLAHRVGLPVRPVEMW